ncbi:MAG: lipase family protein [Candidatus Hodarchaeota archaeon]
MTFPIFNLEKAVLLMTAAHGAYYEKSEINDILEPHDLELYHFIDNPETDTQGYIAIDDKHLVLAFRGTEPDSFRDWFTNAKIHFKKYPLIDKWFRKPKVHSGFLEAYESIQEEVKTKISELLKEKDFQEILITGHSLAAAIATLAALDLTISLEEDVTLYTFGGPYVGDKWFVRYFNKKVKNTFRITNAGDLAPYFPPRVLGYHHIETEVYIDDNNNLNINPSHDRPFYESLEDLFNFITGEAGKNHNDKTYLNLLKTLLETKETEK